MIPSLQWLAANTFSQTSKQKVIARFGNYNIKLRDHSKHPLEKVCNH